MSQKLSELADRVEASDKPDRELFSDAFAACFSVPKIRQAGFEHIGDGIGPYTEEYKLWCRLNGRFDSLTSFGAWVDAAILLVPDGCFPLIEFRLAHCRMTDINGNKAALENAYAMASTPALAICAAALRARI